MILLLLACSTGGGSSDDSGFGASDLTCDPFLQADGKTASGFEYCYEDPYELGAVNRVSAEACAGDPRATVPACLHADEGDCAKDADCGGGQVCGAATDGPYCRCYAVCSSDADCGSDHACMCALQPMPVHEGGGAYGPHNIDECVPATCRTGADCASGECGAAPNQCGQGGTALGLYCRTAEDECHTNSDCAQPTPVCTFSPSAGRWACFESAHCE